MTGAADHAAAAGAPRAEVELYTDGGCQPNPGPGGYGAILVCGGQRRELSGGFRRTTNNRMEILAVVAGLRALTASATVTVFSDSRYVVNSMSRGWARRWRERGWRRTETETALNPDLWGELLDQCARHRVTFRWVRGHAGHPLNERCDQLATHARACRNLPPDPGYETAAPALPPAPATPPAPLRPVSSAAPPAPAQSASAAAPPHPNPARPAAPAVAAESAAPAKPGPPRQPDLPGF